MKSAAFRHLLTHYRTVKSSLSFDIECYKALPDQSSVIHVAKNTGALECLYWQALGNGLTNFAKGIRRTIDKAKAIHGIGGM